MKRSLCTIALIAIAFFSNAQTIFVSDIENLGLTSGQYYNGSGGGNGFMGSHAFFPTVWDTSFGGFWSAGWAASAVYDSSTAGFTNQYGCAANKGYNNSNIFAVGTSTSFSPLTIRLTDSLIGKTVSGFYVCNSTYAYKAMKNGDAFAKKFGDTTGTGCNCAQGTYPDWFKLTVKKYSGGSLQNDSVEFYLADYRFSNGIQDYILNNWTWINLAGLGNTDSLQFTLHSSDNGSFGMNTPAYFCLDDLTLDFGTGVENVFVAEGLNIYPNPAFEETELVFNTEEVVYVSMKVIDVAGREMAAQSMNSFAGTNKFKIDVSQFPAGVYYVVINAGSTTLTKKLIKQ